MPVDQNQAEALAARILAAGDSASSIPPITDALPGFDLADAYEVSALVMKRRIARGERPVGWKIGFTNETIWDEYGVHAPIWGPMYSSTVASVQVTGGSLALRDLVEPRIEPEIAFRIAVTPHPNMEEGEILACIDTVAHGFEIVQSIFPGWRFTAADTVAAFALHGRYRHGPFIPIAAQDRTHWLRDLASFEIALLRDGVEIDRGAAANVLGGGPLTALRHFVRGLAEFSPAWKLQPGDLVTTGTVTRAFPVMPSERWSTKLAGLPPPGMHIAFV
jgi:2-keto-4-pentenoate hydratase